MIWVQKGGRNMKTFMNIRTDTRGNYPLPETQMYAVMTAGMKLSIGNITLKSKEKLSNSQRHWPQIKQQRPHLSKNNTKKVYDKEQLTMHDLNSISYFYFLIEQFHPKIHYCTIVHKLTNIYTVLISKDTAQCKQIYYNKL